MNSNKLNVLMTTMAMDIGGAETHILELCKGLANRGHQVTLVSNGGVYVNELEAEGVRHINAPLNKRGILDIAKSYFILKKIIRDEKPDIVHAHARIPGFVCGLIRLSEPFEFVTTAHWVFESSGLQGKLTNWGDKSMAVSEDIKKYLVDNYYFNKSNIFVTINGIDTNKFSPEISADDIKEELAISGPTLVHVSRLDRSRALVAGQLIESAERLSSEIEGLNIVIAGSGNLYNYLKEKAKEVNARIGRKCINMTGARTDINKIIASGDIFVGVSRAVLEAMSEAKPVIVAGDEGYIGLFTQENLDVAWSTNFCCRGCEMSDKEKLTEDIISLMSLSDEERTAMGNFCREVVLDSYSVEKMTDDYLTMYSAKVKKPCKILLSGYYGYNNAGDDAILHSIKDSLDKIDLPLENSVLAYKFYRNASIKGFRRVNRFNPIAIFRAISNCDLLISGGGSLMQDKTSTRSLVYYLSVIKLAKLMGKKILIYANGIGPVTKKGNRRRMKATVESADIVTLRETSSYNELIEMGVKHNNMHVTADPVLLIDGTDSERSDSILEQIGITGKRPILAVSVRSLNSDKHFRSKLVELLDYAQSSLDMDVVFIIMQAPDDISTSADICSRMKEPPYMLSPDLSSEDIMGVTSRVSCVISMRLHTLIFAAKECVPVIGIECDPKITYYNDILKMPSLGTPAEFDVEKAKVVLKDVIENHKAYKDKVSQAIKEMKNAARDNEAYLKEIIELCLENK